MHPPAEPGRAGGSFARFAWILLDWAASAFSTVLITLVVTYVERFVMPDGAWGMRPGVVWAWTLAAAMLASAIVVPWAAAWADRHDAHRHALLVATLAGVGGLGALAAVPTAAWAWVLLAVVVANVGFDLAQAFTGSLLPRIVGPAEADRLSAQGFAAGYAGGAIALAGATALVAAHDRLGLDVTGGLKLAFAVTATWWLVFSLPAAVANDGGGGANRHAAHSSRELVAFARRLVGAAAGGPDARFAAVLSGAMLALGAIQTAIAQFTSLALERFDLDGPALVRLVLLVQAVALPGALAVGWLSRRCGRRAAATLCLGGWIAVLGLAWSVRTPAQLHALAILLALVLGGAQSLLRAAVAVLVPAGHAGVAFGLLLVGTKLAGCAAGIAFGGLAFATGVPQAGLHVLVAQLLVAWWCLRRME